jgi:hypothetical protein
MGVLTQEKVHRQAEVDVGPLVGAVHRHGAHPLRAVVGTLLLVEVRAVDALGVALEREGPVPQVRQEHRGDPGVVVDHLTLGEPGLGIQDLFQVGELEPPAVDVDDGGAHEWTLGEVLVASRRPATPLAASSSSA